MKIVKGDLVRYVGRNPRNKPNVYGWVGTAVKHYTDSDGDEGWIVFPPLPEGATFAGQVYYPANLIAVSALRALRGGEGADETLTWLPVPQKETV